MANWHYASGDEAERIQRLPSAASASTSDALDPALVYRVVQGVVSSREGELVRVPNGLVVKLLEHPVDEPWCYQVEAVSIWAMNGTMDLARGAPVALFHPSKMQTTSPPS